MSAAGVLDKDQIRDAFYKVLTLDDILLSSLTLPESGRGMWQ